MTTEEQQDGREEVVRLGDEAGCPQISVDYKTQRREQTADRAKPSVKEKEKSTSEAKLRLELKPVSSPGIKVWKIFKFSLLGLYKYGR